MLLNSLPMFVSFMQVFSGFPGPVLQKNKILYIIVQKRIKIQRKLKNATTVKILSYQINKQTHFNLCREDLRKIIVRFAEIDPVKTKSR